MLQHNILLELKKTKTLTLINNSESYTIEGNRDASTILWCSNNNISFCNTDWQRMAMNYTYVQAYVWNGIGQGGYWNANMDSEDYDRQKKRWTLDADGYITGRYIWKLWLSGSMTGVIYREGYGSGGSWFTNENRVIANTEWTRILNDVKNGEYIYVIYTPINTSDYGQITFNLIIQTADD